MATKAGSHKIVREFQDIDDIVRLVTGKRIHNLVARGLDLMMDNPPPALEQDEPPTPLDSPYRVLGVRPDASDLVVKASYRALVRAYHPDTGEKPDPKKFQACVEAHNKIVEMRKK